MRRIIVEVLGVCLLGLAAGCGGSQQVEMPTNPTPPPGQLGAHGEQGGQFGTGSEE